jgi:outer membrane biosynthesis protein TonB
MSPRVVESRVMIWAGSVILLTAILMGSFHVGPAAVLAGVTPTVESPVDTPTVESPVDTPTPEPADTPVPPTNTPKPTKKPTKKQPQPTQPPVYVTPTPAPTPVVKVFRPAPRTGGGGVLGLSLGNWMAGLGLILIGLGLAWRRRR